MAQDLHSMWAILRSTRADPPGRASQGERRGTYTSALEQAEQMFAAARRVGTATRPLLLFYGLSQAGRAMAAAANSLHDGDHTLKGHGITSRRMESGVADVITFSKSQDGEEASFKRLSKVLGSATWDGNAPVSVGTLWGALPENWQLRGNKESALPVDIDSISLSREPPEPIRLNIASIPNDVMPSDRQVTSRLRQFLEKYPILAGYDSIEFPGGMFSLDGGGVVQLTYASESRTYTERLRTGNTHRTRYRNTQHYAFPSLSRSGGSTHPMMIWWTLMYALSMLARYHPEAWARHIAVDSSENAVAIEMFLVESLSALPELVHQCLREVTDAGFPDEWSR